MKFLKKYLIEIFATIIFFFVIICSYNFFNNLLNLLYNNAKTTECHEIYGYFGSYFGVIIGTIISAVTLFFVFLTYNSQRKDTKSQRQLITQQQFESTFFNMLNIHIDIKKNLKMDFNEVNFKLNEYKGVDNIKINGL